jgi:DNA-binding beta-propeller fold protein YncE
MRFLTSLYALSAVTGFALLAGCSGGFAGAPMQASPRDGTQFLMSRVQTIPSAIGLLPINARSGSRYACPAMGPLKYVSSYPAQILIYTGKFDRQAPCGVITSGISRPRGIYVSRSTHDLYVAQEGAPNILVFHRGETTAYNIYTDPTLEIPRDVTVANDGTVIVSNSLGPTISTWIGGPNGGTFVGNFQMTNAQLGGYITVDKNGTVYYDDFDNGGGGAIWSLSCPAGACGPQTRVAGVTLGGPGGMAIDDTGDLIVLDVRADTTDTFELPNPMPRIIHLRGVNPFGLAINKLDHHVYVADPSANNAQEYLYPDGKLVGTVKYTGRGDFWGIAVDP